METTSENFGYRSDIARLIESQNIEFIKSLCHLADPYDRFLASLVLRKLTAPSEEVAWDYRSVGDYAEQTLDFNPWLLLSAEEDPALVKHNFFQLVSEAYAGALNCVVWDAWCGLPLYKQGDAESFVEASTSDEHYCFVHLMAKNNSLVESHHNPPQWATTLFVKSRDVVAYSLFYNEMYGIEEIAARRAALKAYLKGQLEVQPAMHPDATLHESGSSVVGRPPERPTHKTRLMRIQDEVLRRYYGANFDSNDAETICDTQKRLSCGITLIRREPQ